MPSSAPDLAPYSNYRMTARLELQNKPGIFAFVATLIARMQANLGAVDIVEVTKQKIIRDVTFDAANDKHAEKVVAALHRAKGVKVISVSDAVFLAHLGGKLYVRSKYTINTRNRLSTVYTPGVARVAKAIAEDPSKVYALTIKRNSVAVVSDGSAVLGLGDLGPEAALPVMEGKAVIFKEFAGIDAWPICLATKNVNEIVRTVQNIAPVFGGINLEDISAPRCFEIEERLRKTLDIPVMHDDQHGTAIVVLAALKNALRIVGKEIGKIKVVVNGMGSAGVACCQILAEAGVRHLVGCDKKGMVLDSESVSFVALKKNLRDHIRMDMPGVSLKTALKGADVFIGVSSGNILEPKDLKVMNKNRIVFAMANPDPEIAPEKAMKICRVFATGRSDMPNQINNALAFPGVFKGALAVRASTINEAMKLAAAHALAHLITKEQLSEEYIVPSLFDKRVVDAVAEAVSEAARVSGVARSHRKR